MKTAGNTVSETDPRDVMTGTARCMRRAVGVEILGEYVRKLESVPRGLAGLICADLRSCPGVGYPMARDLQAIAFEQR